MSKYQPYKFWTREEIFYNIKKTCEKTENFELIERFKEMVFDNRWDPIINYNGCNVIQDELHIQPACFEHDYDWFVLGGGNKYDLKFRKRCIQFGSTKYIANRNYIGVRLGWIFYFKWVKILKK